MNHIISRAAVGVMLCVLMLTLNQTVDGKAGGARRVAEGIWGGDHIRLSVTRMGASIEYDCGTGTIDAPLKVDRRGSFLLKGTHGRGHAGPIRINEPDSTQAASYTGRLRGNELTLTVKLTGTGQTLGTYQLHFGREPHLMRCL